MKKAKWSCQFCAREFSRKWNLERHIKLNHLKNSNVKKSGFSQSLKNQESSKLSNSRNDDLVCVNHFENQSSRHPKIDGLGLDKESPRLDNFYLPNNNSESFNANEYLANRDDNNINTDQPFLDSVINRLNQDEKRLIENILKIYPKFEELEKIFPPSLFNKKKSIGMILVNVLLDENPTVAIDNTIKTLNEGIKVGKIIEHVAYFLNVDVNTAKTFLINRVKYKNSQ